MKKKLLIIFAALLLGVPAVHAQQMPIEKVRDLFFAMDRSEGMAFQLYKALEKNDLTTDPLMMAYRGAASAASAGTVSGVRKKLEYFNNGKRELEKAVAIRPLDMEIHFLRLATQLNAPGFLGYNDDIKNDKAIVIQALSKLGPNPTNAYLYLRMCRFLVNNAELSKEERIAVNQIIYKLKLS